MHALFGGDRVYGLFQSSRRWFKVIHLSFFVLVPAQLRNVPDEPTDRPTDRSIDCGCQTRQIEQVTVGTVNRPSCEAISSAEPFLYSEQLVQPNRASFLDRSNLPTGTFALGPLSTEAVSEHRKLIALFANIFPVDTID